MENLYIFDCEVFIHDWLFVFKHKQTKEYTVIWNDREALEEFMQRQPLLAGFNNKHYDQFILKGVMVGLPRKKSRNSMIISFLRVITDGNTPLCEIPRGLTNMTLWMIVRLGYP